MNLLDKEIASKRNLTCFLFMISGFSALTYQVAWQRALYILTGTDLVSTTIVVTTFMLGLGAGALAGGTMADRLPKWRVQIFALTEMIIGLYGFMSLKIIDALALTHIETMAEVFFKSFTFLLIPTFLMGTTLPILITHLNEKNKNIGVNTSDLYMSNTFGAAMGAAATGFVLFRFVGLSQTVLIAAVLNLFVAAMATTINRISRP
jgi:predicted membrane-bound spermidine synthase